MGTATASPPLSVQVKDAIDLTDKESQIFNRLLEVLRNFSLDTQLRVAGGWVRDKLLGKDCYDIDIAIDNMMGKEFCEKVNEYLSSTGQEVQGVHVIQSNPEQSKHLETARMKLFDMWVDFVNLRSEEYCETSRIPTMRFGTAEEDAYRRDLTINSLFYNINTNSVEDLTGRGITDLKSGKIVTPLPPKETFLDDPLRVLRAIRFGARFNFVLDEALKEAAASSEVKTAMADKISRERIGHEIDLMISGNHQVKAVHYICDLQLFWVVFSLPPAVQPSIPEECERICVNYTDAAWNLIQSVGAETYNDDQKRISLYASLFLPLRKTVYKESKKKTVPAVDYIIRNSLKLKAKDAETVINIHHASEKFTKLIPLIESNKDAEISELNWAKILIDVPTNLKLQIVAGLLLREIKEYWRVALLVSTLLYPEVSEPEVSNMKVEDIDNKQQVYKLVESAIVELGLDSVWEVKPLINGKDIMDVMHLKPGPDVKEWTQKVVEWQLAHPDGKADECIQWLRDCGSKRVRME